MTTYTSIPNSSLEPGKPIRSIDGLALRDNPIAITEGAAGAPKIQTAAIQDDAITKDKLQSPAAGWAYLICRLQTTEMFAYGSESYPQSGLHRFTGASVHLGVTILVPGVIRCYVEHRSTGGTVWARILKNEVQQVEWSTTSTSYVARTLDLSVDVGDVIIFQQKGTIEVSVPVWRNLLIYSNNPSMAVA